jgi:hypothetical protein
LFTSLSYKAAEKFAGYNLPAIARAWKTPVGDIRGAKQPPTEGPNRHAGDHNSQNRQADYDPNETNLHLFFSRLLS